MDSQASSHPPKEWFPPSLETLVKDEYLNEKDFNYMTEGYEISYIRPRAPEQNPIVLTIQNSRAYGELKEDGSFSTLIPVPFDKK